MLLDENGNQRFRHRLSNGGNAKTRLLIIGNTQFPTGKAVGSLEDDAIATLYENRAAKQIGARLWINQLLDLTGDSVVENRFLGALLGRGVVGEKDCRDTQQCERNRFEQVRPETRFQAIHRSSDLAVLNEDRSSVTCASV